jgi:hypothetical protein
MKKMTVILVVMIISSFYSFSQNLTSGLNSGLIFINKQFDLFESNLMDDDGLRINLDDVKGSPFLDKNFIKGYILDLSTNNKMDVSLRYNIYNDEMEVINPVDNSIGALAKKERYVCFFGGDKFVFIKGKTKSGYYKELVSNNTSNGSMSLLVKYSSIYIPKKYGTTPLQQGVSAKFNNDESFYLLMDDTLIKKPKKKKKFMELFSSNKALMISYISKNKLKVDKERDLTRIITYYNSLLEK